MICFLWTLFFFDSKLLQMWSADFGRWNSSRIENEQKCFQSFRFSGHNFVDLLDGRFQCLNCSRHIVGYYQGKEHAPQAENLFGQIINVQCDQAGRIPICDKCTRPVATNEEAFQHETRVYHMDCARCNRCRKKLFQVPCRKLGSALGKEKFFFGKKTKRNSNLTFFQFVILVRELSKVSGREKNFTSSFISNIDLSCWK